MEHSFRPNLRRATAMRAGHLAAFGVALAVGVSMVQAQTGTRSIITFAEHLQYTLTAAGGGPNTGFNSQDNAFFITTDGRYRVEAFWNQTDGHFHNVDPDFAVLSETWTDTEENHNWSDANGPSALQGMRITRVDGGPFTLVGMDLHGGVSVGTFRPTNPPTGRPEDPEEGTWRLYTGDMTFTNNWKNDLRQTVAISFGSRFARVTEIYLADPSISGGTGTLFAHNAWDNIVLEQTTP